MSEHARTSVLILSGSSGAGHRIAADTVQALFADQGLPVTHLDAYRFLHPVTRWLYTTAHATLLEFLPRSYGAVYARANQSVPLARLSQWSAFRARANLARVLTERRPSLVVTTHSVGCALAAPLKKAFPFRLALLTTDYYAHAHQVHRNVDGYCVSHVWAADDLVRAGIPSERIRVTGIPLRPEFDRVPSRAAARQSLGLPQDRPVVLVTRGGMAVGRETIALLGTLLEAPAMAEVQVVVLLGERARSVRLVARTLTPTPRLRLEPFVSNIDVYLAAADVVVGKAGGLSSTEVFTVGRPLVIYAPNAGIERPNVRRFVAAGAARDTGRSPARVVAAVRDLLDHPAHAAALVAAGQALLTPASRQALQEALGTGVRNPEPARAFARG